MNDVRNEKFRSDLYYRLSVFIIHIPALRDRREDIPLLTESFVSFYSFKTNKKIKSISPEFLNRLSVFNWPGNIRELKNIVERSIILSDDGNLTRDLLPLEVLFPDEPDTDNDIGTLKEMEKIHIQKILGFAKGNRTKAAKMLGIGIPTLYRKLKQHGIG